MADPKTIAATQVIRLPMRAAEIASVRVLDTDLIVILKSGQRVSIRDGAMRAMIDTNLRIAFADGEIRAADLLKQVGTVQADALSDLSVASKDAAATADASKTPDANAPGKPLDVLSSNAELNKNITDLLTKQQTQIELLSRQLEAFSSNIEGKLTQIIQPDAASQAPAAAKSGFLANISPAWGALGALGAAGAAGGGGAAAAGVVSAASSGPVNLVSLSLTGTVTLGPMLAANQLRVVAYDRDGKILGSDETVEGTTGAFEIKITNGYSGVVIFKVLDGNPNEADYMDEATQRGLSLGKTGGALPDLRAIVVTEGIVPKTVHINPLTELAAVKSGLAEGSVVTTRSSAELLTISRALAKTLALSTTGQLLSDIAVIPTVNLDGSPNAGANPAGKLLDTISQLERLNNFTSPTAAIATVAGQLQEVDLARGESGFKDPTVTNVAQFQTAVLQTPPTIAGVTFSADTGVSGTDLITSNGTQNITVKFSKALESTRTLSWKTTDSGVWSAPVAGNGTDTLVLTGASLSSGSRTLQFRYTSTATSLSEAAQVNTGVNLVYILDTTAPTTPVVTDLIFSVDSGTSGTDRITNSAAQTVSGTITSAVFATERIFGSVDGGGTWSEITNRSTSSVTGATTFNWNVAALVNQTAPDTTKSLVFQVRDAAGNISSNSNATSYVLDTTVPDNSIDLSTITISADTGTPGDFRTATKVQTITAQLGKRLDLTPANGETLWGSVDNGTTWTDLNGSIVNLSTGGRNLVWTNVSLIEGDNTIVFKITDVAGNTLAALGNRTYFLETLPPPPTLTLAADTGVNTNDGITRNGRFNVTDVLSGHTWQYSLNGGNSWTAGSGTFFIAPADSYALGAIQLRQTSEGGLVSAVDKTLRDITIDTSAAAPTLALAADTGTSSVDFITNNGTINVTGLETGATWRYRLGGGDWQTGGAVLAGGRSSFVLPSSGLLGTRYEAFDIQVEQTDRAGNTSAITSYANAVTVRTTPPVMAFASGGGLSLSADSGTTITGIYDAGTSPQNTDWLTKETSQTISATLSSALALGNTLLGSIDNGVSFISLNTRLTGASLSWTGVNLLTTNSANSRIILKVVDIAGNESVLVNQAYTVDTTASSVALADGSALTLSNQGISTSGRFYTITNQQLIRIELSRILNTVGDDTETLWARTNTNTGTSWVNITSFLNGTVNLSWDMSLSGTTLTAGANQLQLKVTDKAGNEKSIVNVDYTLVTNSYLTGLTSDQTAALGSDVALLTAEQVAQLGQTQLGGLTATQIGQLASASPSRLTDLNAAQIGFLGIDINGLLAAQVAALSTTTQIGGLTAAQIAALSTTQFDALSTPQLAALTEAAIGGMTSGQVGTLIAADVQALGTDIKGLTTANVILLSTGQVQALTTAQLQALTNTQVKALTTAQVQALTNTQVQALTNTQVQALTTAQVQALTTAQVPALTNTQVQALTNTQVQALTTAQVQALTTAQVTALTNTQVQALTTTQVQALTTTQVAALMPTQVAALTLEQVQALTTAQLNALNSAGLLDDITQPLASLQVNALGLTTAVDTTDKLALFNSALQAASGATQLNLNNMASGAAAVVAAVNGGALTVANLTNLGLTGVTSTNLEAIRSRIDDTSTGTDASLVNSMSELRAIVVNASGELADRNLNAQEAADGVTVAVALDGASVGQTITLTLPGSSGGTAQSITQNVTSTDLANGFASINISAAQLIASGQGNKAVTARFDSGSPFAVDTFVYDIIAPTATVGSATYFANAQEGSTNLTGAAGFTSRTIVLTGTNFSTLLEAGENATTNIKARLDWSKLSYDFDGNDTGVDGSTYLGADGKLYGARGAFTVNDIESAFVTNGTTLTIKLTSAKARALESYNDFTKGDYFGADSNANNTYWTSGTGAGKGNQADTIDVLSGFLRDTAGNASTNSTADAAITYAGPAQTISLGAGNGNLLAPTVVAVNTGTLAAPVWVNKTFYHWDRSGDGTISGDFATHDTLDGLFYRNSNFTGGTAGADTTSGGFNTTDFRYGDLTTFNNIQLALPTAAASGDGAGLSISANDANNQRSDLRAVWDQFNTSSTTGSTGGGGTPPGWSTTARLWAADQTSGGAHTAVTLFNGYIHDNADTFVSGWNTALQLSNPTPTVSGVTYYGNYANEANFAAGALTRTMVINGTNFNQLLDMVNSGDTMGANGTDIKARLDWSKFTYDFDGNSTNGVQTAAAGTFTLADIESARVTSSNTLAIKFTRAKITALEAYSGDSSGGDFGELDANGQTQRDYFGADSNANNSYWLTNTGAGRGLGNQADGVDIVNGFFKDVAGNVVASTSSTYDNLAITYAAPVSTISQGTYGNLIAPVVVAVNTGTLAAPVWVNKTFYYWDLSGNGATTGTNGGTSAFSTDRMDHNFLDSLFYQNSEFNRSIAVPERPTTTTPTDPGNQYDTTSELTLSSGSWGAGTNFRYGDLAAFNNWRLALVTGAVNDSTVGNFLVVNSQQNQRADLSAIWDQFNTSMTTGQQIRSNGPLAPGWTNMDLIHSATSVGAGGHIVMANDSYVYTFGDTDARPNAILQVL
jgi:hypothetical protein